jgi:hypothetical protein
MKKTTAMPAEVEAVFAAYPATVRARLMRLRKLILTTAAKMYGVGALEETLRWGQPSYLTQTETGSTIRIDRDKTAPGRVCLYFICHTDLVATFRELYPELDYGGNRAILLDVKGPLPEDALRHCISLALSYKTRRKHA